MTLRPILLLLLATPALACDFCTGGGDGFVPLQRRMEEAKSSALASIASVKPGGLIEFKIEVLFKGAKGIKAGDIVSLRTKTFPHPRFRFLLTSPEALKAFDLSRDPKRASYAGAQLGDVCLTARRLVEAGSKFVTVFDGGWDMHEDVFTRLTFGYPGPLFQLDIALSALIDDLAESGMLDRTLVLVMGEMGRTPKINAKAGRDHWPKSNFCLLAGGGIRSGQVIGATDARGELPVERPVTPEELVATVYERLGLFSTAVYETEGGRRVQVLPDGVRPIGELL